MTKTRPRKPRKGADPMGNPWGVPARASEVMSTICRIGSQKEAAAALGITLKTVEAHCARASRAMGVRRTLERYLTWDRWLRQQQAEQSQETVDKGKGGSA